MAVMAVLVALVVIAVALAGANLRIARGRTWAETRFRALVEHAHDKISIIDADGNFVYVSPAAGELYGMTPEELLGPFQLDGLVHTDDRATVTEAFQRSLDHPGELVRFELRIIRRDGVLLYVENTYLNLLNDRAVRGVVATEHDISARILTEQLIRREATFNALALKVSAELGATPFAQQVDRLHELQREMCQFFEVDFATSVHIDEGNGMQAIVTSMLGTTPRLYVESRPPMELVTPNLAEKLRDGERFWFSDRSAIPEAWAQEREFFAARQLKSAVFVPLYDDREVLGYFSMGTTATSRVWDTVTLDEVQVLATVATQRWQRSRSEYRREAADQRARLLGRYVTDAVFIVAADGRLSWASPSTSILSGWEDPKLLGSMAVDFVHPDDSVRIGPLADAAYQGTTGIDTFRIRTAAGMWRWCEVTLAPADVEQGPSRELVIVVRDVHDRRMETERLAEQVNTDALTGLPNRTALLREIGAVSRSDSGPFAVAFCDLDGFKEINDASGHRAGDEVLVVVAERLRRALRPDDLVARFGGDEFVVLLRDVDERQALHACGRMLEAMADPMVITVGPVSVTGSIGVVLARAGHDALSLVTAADRLMYRAKHSGKNRIEVETAS
jgi:diguanylate cyclase (GGDEF)-like protein/PAS domain S-box-containing protein